MKDYVYIFHSDGVTTEVGATASDAYDKMSEAMGKGKHGYVACAKIHDDGEREEFHRVSF